MNEMKKKRVIRWGLIGLISGLILSLIFYFAADNNPSYFIFTAFGCAMGAAQGYVTSPKE